MTVLRPRPPADPNVPRRTYSVRVVPTPPSKRRRISRHDREREVEVDRTWPAVDFPVYGLDRTWAKPRWLYAVGGAFGKPPQIVWLAHGDRPFPERGHPRLLVASYRLSDDQQWCFAGQDAEEEMAFEGIVRLIDSMMPDFVGSQRQRFMSNWADYAYARAGRWARWAPTRWRVDGRVVTARFARYAGAWAAYAFERDKFALLVVGAGLPPHGLQLRQLRSGTAYHFNLDQPIAQAAELASQEQALGSYAQHVRKPRRLHNDHRKIIAGEHRAPPPS